MYLLFRTVSDLHLGIVQRVGHYLDFVIGYLDPQVKEVVDISHLKAVIIDDEKVALAWKFAGNYSGYLSVRQNTLSNDQLDIINSNEPEGTKVKYWLTDEDRTAAAKFMKIVLRKILDDAYDKKLHNLSLGVTNLESHSWQQQRSEAEAYTKDSLTPTPLLSSLAQARGITTDDMVQRVNTAVSNFNAQVTELLAKKQAIETEIKSCENINDCNVLMHRRFGYNMPVNQQRDINYQGSSQVDL